MANLTRRQQEKLDYAKWEARVSAMSTNFARNPKKHAPVSNTLEYRLEPPPGRSVSSHSSLSTPGGSASKQPDKVYTGVAMLGIGTLHKSNAVPVFAAEDAKDIARMRR